MRARRHPRSAPACRMILAAALCACLGAAAPAGAQDGPGQAPALAGALPPQAPIGESFLPFRVSLRWGTAGLGGGLADYMDGGLSLGLDLDVPVSHRLSIDVPVNIVHRRDLKHPLTFPYTDEHFFTPGFVEAKGYCNTIGLGLRWEPHHDLRRETRFHLWSLEPSVRAGLNRAFVGWEPRLQYGGSPSQVYKNSFRFGSQTGWGPYAGAGLSVVRYSADGLTVVGLGIDLYASHLSADGDELLPAGTSISGSVTGISLRLFGGTR
jgi:hypothetical protein